MTLIREESFTHDSGDVTAYLIAGPPAGPLMILCHGWPAIARTWKAQIETFAGLGYQVVAPDMPGYGRSTVSSTLEHYSLEKVNRKMTELLSHLGNDRAIWVGHDWGAVAVWSFAAHYPDKVVAVVGLARPYHTLELGLEEVLPTINRDIFPQEDYPYGQYDYQVFFEKEYEKATSWFELDPEGVLKAVYMKGKAEEVGKPGVTATVAKTGGWFGGAPAPPPQLRAIPEEALCVDGDIFQEVLSSMMRTGFRGANAWYMNHQRNREYSLASSKSDGYLHMPVLFIGAAWDAISDVTVSSIADAQRQYCTNLTEKQLDAGHWVALERPSEVNALIARWLVESVPQTWPM